MVSVSRQIRIFATATFVASLCGCGFLGNVFDFVGNAEAATAELFEAIDREDYETIHDTLALNLQTELNPAQLHYVFGRVRNEAGVCGAPELVNYDGSSTTTGTIVHLVVRADCERGTVQADLTWRVEGGELHLAQFSFMREITSSVLED